ncbi:MAG: hypothetical protein ACR2H5_13735 [Ktedonobacteraceae bacterium]
METNPKEYDTRSARIPQPNRLYEGKNFSPQGGWQRQARPQPSALPQSDGRQQPKKAPTKMPKARVLAMANKLKKGLVIASIMGFGMFGGLATLHQVGTTATTNKTSSTSAQTSSSQNSSNFLKQSGTTTATKTATSTPTPTPTSTATATTAPVTGSSTS